VIAWSSTAQARTILHSDVEAEIVTPVIADFLVEGVARAEREGHVAYLIELDTPGGLDTSMRRIVQAFLETQVPVIVHVPAGGRAASAGAIIGMSAHVLTMAPGTSIGAATPVDLQGGDIGAKIINDATSYAVDIARARGRDQTFASEAVRKGRSDTSVEALEVGVIDLIAPDLPTLLADLDGARYRVITTPGTGPTLHGPPPVLRTAGATLVEHDMSWIQRVRQRLADPNLAFIFLSVGTLALIYELANPGIGAGGVVGIILIVLGMFALSVLPVNTAGAALLLLALALFVGEVFTPGVGIFAAGGVASLILGGLLLFKGSIGVSLSLLVPLAIVIGAGVAVAGRLTWRARMAPTATGEGQFAGHTATIKRVGPEGAQAFIEGAWWRVRLREGSLHVGQQVTIIEADGLELIAEPAPASVREGEEQ
jgi:membrane-bound serine protease (ClpP class)